MFNPSPSFISLFAISIYALLILSREFDDNSKLKSLTIWYSPIFSLSIVNVFDYLPTNYKEVS